MRRGVQLVLLAFATAALVAAPAFAEENDDVEMQRVTCSGAEPGSTMTCVAEGLEPATEAAWTAEFTDGSTDEGTVIADPDGEGSFSVDVPDAPVGGYDVAVQGTADDGSDYDASTQGVILPIASTDEDDSTEEEGAAPPEDDDGALEDDGGLGDSPPPADDAQVSPAPDGAVAAGLGGTAGDARGLSAALAAALLAAVGFLGLKREGEVG